jgi:hypothetical protein
MVSRGGACQKNVNIWSGVALGAIGGSFDGVSKLNDNNLGLKRMMKLAAPMTSRKAALRGFEGRLSSVLLPLFAIVTVVLAIYLWGMG